MKKILPALFMLYTFIVAQAQQTHYGTSAGLQGAAHSYFGYFAGNAALNTSYENSFFGSSSGRVTTTGFGNTAVGFNSLRYNTTGYWNTAIGSSAMLQNISGYRNTAIGRSALQSNVGGYYNVANGYYALLSNTSGYHNTAIGSRSLNGNQTGNSNTAIGFDALYSNPTGSYNTATGSIALYSNLGGNNNVATGHAALYNNTSGSSNTAIGNGASAYNTTGYNNTASGAHAMYITTTGSHNCAYGAYSLVSATGSYNSAFGAYALNSDAQIGCTGSFNSAFGYQAGPPVFQACDYSNTTALGALALVTASNQVRVGNTDVTSIGGQVAWSNLSDGRFKKDLKDDVAGIDFIKNLKPVSYIVDKDALDRFLGVPDSMRLPKTEIEKNTRQVGFVAQEVDALIKKSGFVFSGVETPKHENDPYAIRYGEFVVPLVKAMQELIAEVDDLKEQLNQSKADSTTPERTAAGPFLYQNNPNPFSNTTEIQLELPETTRDATIIVYNLEGKQLKTIAVNERGKASAKIPGNELNAGMYLYALIADGKVVDTKRLILTK